MRVEKWCGHDVRFVEIDGEWWAVIDDIYKALGDFISPPSYTVTRIGDELTKKVKVDDTWVYVTNELGIYKLIFESNSIDARKFRNWSATVLRRLRSHVGLEPYEVMRMLEPEIQEDINNILDTLFYDEETGQLMQSITVAGGDVEHVPFEE